VEEKGGWTSYSGGNGVLALLIDGDELWAGTTGGVVRHNLKTGDYVKYTTLDGLASNISKYIVRDSRGDIWVGSTGDGVARFDGQRWHAVTAIGELAGKDVNVLAADSTGNVWFSVWGGIGRWDGAEWHTTPSTGRYFADVFFEDSRGNAWFAGRSGIKRWDGQGWQEFTEGVPRGSILAITEDEQGNIWFGATGEVVRYDGEKWLSFTVSDRIPKVIVTGLEVDATGNLWAAGWEDFLAYYDGAGWREPPAKESLNLKGIRAVFTGRDGAVWVHASEGLARFDGTAWRVFKTGEELPAGTIQSVVQDDDGTIYAGTSSGIGIYDGKTWKQILAAEGLKDNAVQSITQDSRGWMWFAGQDGAVSSFDGEEWRSYQASSNEDIMNPQIVSDARGNVWFLNDGTPRVFDGANWNTLADGSGAPDTLASGLGRDSNDNIWVISGRNAYCFDGQGWRSFEAPYTLDSIVTGLGGAVWFVTVEKEVLRLSGSSFEKAATIPEHPWHGRGLLDSRGIFWIGVFGPDTGSLCRLNGSAWQRFSVNDGLAGLQVHALAEGKDGRIWAATRGGVSYYDGTTWHSFTTRDGLAANRVNCIFVDNAGNVWAGTDGGVSRYKGEKSE
jgi:ligand-binding sensor domain-containing protein